MGSFRRTGGPAQKPGSLWVQVFRLVSPVLAQIDAAGGESGAAKLVTGTVGVEPAAAVVVAQKGQAALRPEQGFQEIRHAGQGGAILARGLRQDGVEQEHIQRINVVVGGLLKVAAVRPNHAGHLGNHGFAAQLFPVLGLRKRRKQDADGMQYDGFPQQVGIRREVKRKVVGEVVAVLAKTAEKAGAKLRRHAVPDKVEDPDPGKGPEGDFQGAGPIDALLKRVLLPPALNLGEDRVQIFLRPAEEKGLGEQNQMLMAVQLPNVLVVAGFGRIEVGNQAKVLRLRDDVVKVIATPFDARPGFEDVAEERELVRDDLVSSA